MPSSGGRNGPCRADLNLTDSGEHRKECFPVTQQKQRLLTGQNVKEAGGVKSSSSNLTKELDIQEDWLDLLTLHTALPQRWPRTPPLLRVLLLRGLGRVGPPTARFCQHGPTRGKFSDTSPHAESGDRKWGLGPSGFCTGPWPESGQIPTPHPVTGLDTCPTLEAERQDTPISDTFQHLPQGCHSNGPC